MKDSEGVFGAHCFKLSFYYELKVIKKEFTLKSRAVFPHEGSSMIALIIMKLRSKP